MWSLRRELIAEYDSIQTLFGIRSHLRGYACPVDCESELRIIIVRVNILKHHLLVFLVVLLLSLVSTLGLAADEKNSATEANDTFEVSGPARVVDGDTLVIGAQAIRVEGIDAPEDGQSCNRSNGGRWSCGAEATAALRALSAKGVRCVGSEFDAYERLIASCSAGDADIGKIMVLEGMALAYRRYSIRYVADEEVARKASRGVWQGSFVEPWQWRKEKWSDAVSTASSPDCPIKGNISSNGNRIYHAPWSRSYSKTRIDESKGERWFCDEAEALAAGWRAPFR